MINRLKKLFSSEPPPTHRIVECDTRVLESKDGPKPAIFIAADLYDPSAIDVFVGDLVERFKVRRMISPPETSLLLVTVVGQCDGNDLAARWRKRVSEDKVAGVWMSRMEKADIGVAPSGGAAITTYHSILPERQV